MKNRNIFIYLIILLIISFSFISCTKSKVDDSVLNNDIYRVTCIIPHKDDKAYWSVIEQGILDGAKDNNIDVKIVYPSLNYNTDQMLKLLKMAIASKVNCIIISGVEDDNYYLTIKEAVDNGIFVVLVDTDMMELKDVVYVGSNNVEAGVLYANNIAKLKNGNANIGIISGDSVFYNLTKRLDGIKSVVDKYENMNIIDIKYDKFDYTNVENIYNQYLANNEIDTIVCLEGTGGMALNSLLNKEPEKDIYVFDDTPQALEGLSNGYFKGVLIQQKYMMGYKVVDEINSYRKTGKFISRKIYTDTYFIEE